MDYKIKTIEQLKPMLIGFRKGRGLTQQAMAEMLDVTQQTYAKLESNPSSATVGRLMRVLRILNVELVLSENSVTEQNKASTVVVGNSIKRDPIAVGSTRVIVRSPNGTVQKRSNSVKKISGKEQVTVPGNAHLLEKW